MVTNLHFHNGFKHFTKRDLHRRTNFLLTIVFILFFISEFPQAILLLISVFSQEFYLYVYKPLGDLMDILVLINYSISLSIYCLMSKEFRITFRSYFK